ncbi:MAG: IS607 family transposase [Solirubrobacteraceae bacterium]
MRFSEWARREGVHCQTVWKWFRDGQLPVPARQTATGTILVDGPSERVVKAAGVALYARVSSADQCDDLERRMGRLSVWATQNGLAPTVTVGEVGSGLNGSRPKLWRLLADPAVGTVVVEHRECLARFGVEYVEAAMTATGRKLVVVEEREVDGDLVCDITEVLTLMCARLYGRRSAKRRAERAVKAAAGDEVLAQV